MRDRPAQPHVREPDRSAGRGVWGLMSCLSRAENPLDATRAQRPLSLSLRLSGDATRRTWRAGRGAGVSAPPGRERASAPPPPGERCDRAAVAGTQSQTDRRRLEARRRSREEERDRRDPTPPDSLENSSENSPFDPSTNRSGRSVLASRLLLPPCSASEVHARDQRRRDVRPPHRRRAPAERNTRGPSHASHAPWRGGANAIMGPSWGRSDGGRASRRGARSERVWREHQDWRGTLKPQTP